MSKNKIPQFSFPKLPDQDDFLLYLQNNNYSMQTVYSYARDLSILATFLHFRDIKFQKLSKKDMVLYKGYLRAGSHLEDLKQVREIAAKENSRLADRESAENAVRITSNRQTRSKGSRIDENKKEVSEHSNKELKNTTQAQFLDNVYKKVFGALGSVKSAQQTDTDSDGLDARSVNRMLSAFRSYLKFRIDMDLEYPIAPEAVQMIKADKKKSQVADFKDLVKLIEFPTSFEKSRKVGLRNRAMLELLFSTGMRISELIGLNLDQINLDGKLFIMGKGKKERFVYMTPRAMKWLDKYLEYRIYWGVKELDSTGEELLESNLDDKSGKFNVNIGLKDKNNSERETLVAGEGVSQQGHSVSIDKGSGRKLSSLYSIFKVKSEKFLNIALLEELRKKGYVEKFRSPALFIPFRGGRNGKRGARLSTNFFQEKIAEYRRRIGINVPTSAHSLRHGFATYLAENGASPAAIQVLLGHESLQTTTRYVHASDRMAERVHKDLHPLK